MIFRLGEILGKLLWPFLSKRRAVITRNLRIVHGGNITPNAASNLARESFIRTTANLLSTYLPQDLNATQLDSILKIENPEIANTAIAEGKGVILLLAHMGNWELLTRMNLFYGPDIPAGAFYRPLNNPVLNELILSQRQASGTRLFSKKDSLHQVTAFLKSGGILGVLADQRMGAQGELCEFFGRLTRTTPLPSLLARRCKSAVLTLSLRTIAPGKWSAKYRRLNLPPTVDACTKILEESIRDSLIDMFWLQERWRLNASPRMPLDKWLKAPSKRGKIPHRILIWQTESPEMVIPEKYLHQDANYEYAIGKDASEIAVIDSSQNLPIDLILSQNPNDDLKKFAALLGIPLAKI